MRLMSAARPQRPLTVVRVVAGGTVEEHMARAGGSFLHLQGLRATEFLPWSPRATPMDTDALPSPEPSSTRRYCSEAGLLNLAPTLVPVPPLGLTDIDGPLSDSDVEAEAEELSGSLPATPQGDPCRGRGMGKGMVALATTGATTFVKDASALQTLGLTSARPSILSAIVQLRERSAKMHPIRQPQTQVWIAALRRQLLYAGARFDGRSASISFDPAQGGFVTGRLGLGVAETEKATKCTDPFLITTPWGLGEESDPSTADANGEGGEGGEGKGDLNAAQDGSPTPPAVVRIPRKEQPEESGAGTNLTLSQAPSLGCISLAARRCVFQAFLHPLTVSESGLARLRSFMLRLIDASWQHRFEEAVLVKRGETRWDEDFVNGHVAQLAGGIGGIKSHIPPAFSAQEVRRLSDLGKTRAEASLLSLVVPLPSDALSSFDSTGRHSEDAAQSWPRSFLAFHSALSELKRAGIAADSVLYCNPLQAACRSDAVTHTRRGLGGDCQISISYLTVSKSASRKSRRARPGQTRAKKDIAAAAGAVVAAGSEKGLVVKGEAQPAKRARLEPAALEIEDEDEEDRMDLAL
mmetsp:Transcript_22238/g.49491  ORF Transcript_22238/g.49491 Transcript_22238/m.49491 type:complete len:580 (+) Transcript_22238:3-1742(+)